MSYNEIESTHNMKILIVLLGALILIFIIWLYPVELSPENVTSTMKEWFSNLISSTLEAIKKFFGVG